MVEAEHDSTSATADVPPGADKTIAAVLGEIVWLMSQSPEYKQYLISDLEWLVMPPILLRQFRLFYHEGKPVAVVFYRRVAATIDDGRTLDERDMRLEDWNSGPAVKVVRVIALFGDSENVRAAFEASIL